MIPARTMSLWPGLPRLWYCGDAPSLASAVLFATVFNIALMATFYWPSWLDMWFVRVLWAGLFVSSMVSAGRSAFSWKQITGAVSASPATDDALVEAQEYYLRGQYFEAEAVLHQIFAKGAEDVEAALLMISILRRTRRYQQALQCVDRMELIEQVGRWRIELQSERNLVLSAIRKEKEDSEHIPEDLA